MHPSILIGVLSTIYSIELKPLFIPKKNLINDQYIIMLKNNIQFRTFDNHFDQLKQYFSQEESNLNNIEHIYFNKQFQGYSGKFTDKLIQFIRTLEEVEFIEQDSIMYSTNYTIQDGVSWGLARVSHKEKLSFTTYNKYIYDNKSGEGVIAYVLDTGIQVDHQDFEGRAKWGVTTPKDDKDIDSLGHGTHCSGTIAGKKYGIAKKAELIAVKVLSSKGYGTNAEVIKGVDWTIKYDRHAKIRKLRSGKPYKGSVANMSLGGGNSKALDKAVDAAVESGIHFAVAAGNENHDACLSSPASSEKAITVGATTINDERAFFSNYGRCVDIFAPGLYILSSWIGKNNATNVISGTSMATPHVCGLMAYYLSISNSDKPLTHSEMKALLLKHASKGLIKDVRHESPNYLINNGIDAK